MRVIITLEGVIYFRSLGETTFGLDLAGPLVSSEDVVSPSVPVARKSGLPIGGGPTHWSINSLDCEATERSELPGIRP